jgi:transposase
VPQSQTYLLLKNKSNLDKEKDEPERLGRLLKLNRNLSKVYVMKADLKQLWKYRYRPCAESWFKKWY